MRQPFVIAHDAVKLVAVDDENFHAAVSSVFGGVAHFNFAEN